MFKTMRREKQQLSHSECLDILKKNTHGVLSLLLENGYTYALPISYVYHDGHIYYHCHKEGQKMEAMMHHPKVSFCVVDQDEVLPDLYTTLYKSVICFGEIFCMSDTKAMIEAMEHLTEKYDFSIEEAKRKEHARNIPDKMAVLDLKIESMSGKQASRLAKAQRGEKV